MTLLKVAWLVMGGMRESDAQNTHLIVRRHLPVGTVVTKWAFHRAFSKVNHETLGQKICVVTSVGCEYRILLSITKALTENPCGRRI